MRAETPQHPLEDANKLIAAAASDSSTAADCIFQSWSNERQMQAYRQLNKIQDSTDNIPDLHIDIAANGTKHLVRQGSGQTDRCTIPNGASILPSMRIDSGTEMSRRDRVDLEKMIAEQKPLREAKERERLQHPEIPAQQIEGLAIRSLAGDEQAKLDLRVKLDKVMREPAEFREQVLAELEKDGSKLGLSAPHVKIERDENGNAKTVEFRRTRFGVTTETVHLDENLEQQVARANQDFIYALQMHPQGFGKFKPMEGMRAIEIFMGADVKEPSWFMIYRQQQGLPMLDRSAVK